MHSGPTSHSFMSQRLRLHYVDWGNANAPPLLLVHGGRDHCRSWDWTAQELRRDWRVIAMDLRGHGDSAWSPDGDYSMQAFVYDIAQMIHQLKLAPLSIVAHSLGGNIALRYAGLFPENVRQIVSIEGLGPSPKMMAERMATPLQQRWRKWIDERRIAAGRTHKRYATIEEALARMQAENDYLTEPQARHLTIHGVSEKEDGTYSWKFDNYIRVFPPHDMAPEDIHTLWSSIACPTLLLYGQSSWASNPEQDGRASYFKTARVVEFKDAGHWLHHDQFARFVRELNSFLT